jgi:hypothetical protein
MGFMDFAKKAGRAMVMGEIDTLGGVRSQKKLAGEGTATTAVCRAFKVQWDSDEGDPRWGSSTMELAVTPPAGGEPYTWSGEMWVRLTAAKKVDPGISLVGHTLPVRVDPADPQRVAVDWESILAE